MIGFIVDFKTNSVPKYIQLYEYIKKEIEAGNLKNSEKLPSVRAISKMLSISKATVENAYSQLLVEGYIESKVKSGYYVLGFDANELGHFKKIQSSEDHRETVHALEKPFNTDGTEESAFNFIEWKKAINRVLEYETKALLSYGDAKGEYCLRREIASFVHQSRGGVCKPEQVIIGAGIQYLFGLIAATFKSEYDSIAFEYPGFSKGMVIFEDYGYEMVKIPLVKDGIDMKTLENSRANIVYVSPSHQYPTGNVMAIKKRLQLLDWAKKNNAYIIEDDYDSLLRYEGYPVPALQGLNEGENVIYVGSFSKLLIPALRISFMILPESLMAKFEAILPRYSQSVSKIEQLALENFMSEGAFERHIRRIKKIYGRKNALLIDAFKRNESPLLALIGKGSGLHVTLSYESHVNIKKVIDSCQAIGIVLESIAGYKLGNIVVFSYSGVPDKEIENVVLKIIEITEENAGQSVKLESGIK